MRVGAIRPVQHSSGTRTSDYAIRSTTLAEETTVSFGFSQSNSAVHPRVGASIPFSDCSYKDHVVLYTDESKTANGVGIAFVVQSASFSWALPRTGSLYAAELYAIWQALRNSERFAICTDSPSFIIALGNTDTDLSLIHI